MSASCSVVGTGITETAAFLELVLETEPNPLFLATP